MSAQRSGQSSRQREEDDRTDAPDQAKKPKPDNKASAITDEILEHIDRAMDAELGFDEGEEVDQDEKKKRTVEFIAGFRQKPGQ